MVKELTLELPEELTIFTIYPFKEEVISKLEEKKNLIFDCYQVERLDAAGIQLLLSLEKTFLKEKISLKLDNISKEIEETFKLLGVNEILDYEMREE
ncbi:STAS domain-containing protein [Orenia marismortui]|uniref:Anti-anti-sigma factor n=1 Tax=Orenia marismortui TaxID=46469 RepID=A0A4R8H0E9_9FIRM|nr:STAS domain-containing protein [Orenia marismortui]TDX47827.1 anti-anti-sigma factor [Orenia marismortui]